MTPTTRTAAVALERGIRYAIGAVLLVGLRDRNPGAVANAAVAFVATYLPDVLERRRGVTLRPWQRVYTATALLTHSIGMLGPYDDVWWWDHLTHTHTATVFGGVVHAFARRRDRDPNADVIGAVVGLGLLWELMEYAVHAVADRFDREPLLVSYGRTDTVLDLCFNLLGALLVVAFGDRLLGDGECEDT